MHSVCWLNASSSAFPTLFCEKSVAGYAYRLLFIASRPTVASFSSGSCLGSDSFHRGIKLCNTARGSGSELHE